MLHAYNTYVLLLHVFLLVYNVTQPNRCLTLLPLSTDTKQRYEASANLTAEARVGHMCVLYHITQALPHSWDTLKLYCTHCQYTVYCTQYYDCIIKLSCITWNGINMVTYVIFIILIFIKNLYIKIAFLYYN